MASMNHTYNGQLTISRIDGWPYREMISIEIRDKHKRRVIMDLYVAPDILMLALTGAGRQPCQIVPRTTHVGQP
jgi:hypothetical protein